MNRLIKVKAHPGSKEEKIVAKGPDAYEIRVRARAEQGLANAAVLRALAVKLGIEPKRLKIIKGFASPSKIIAVLGETSVR